MIQYIVLVKIINLDLFAKYIEGHLPSLAQYGGKIIFLSKDNAPILGPKNWDVIVIQEWPSSTVFDLWWNSEEYKPWAKIRDVSAAMTIIKCQNNLLK